MHSIQAGVRRQDDPTEDLFLAESENLFVLQDYQGFTFSPVNVRTFLIFSNTNSIAVLEFIEERCNPT